jgi:PTH1 family peptidyl-tRNA hydrolase
VWLIVGLGNPGPRYGRNPHNVGFRVADELARRHSVGPQPFRDKFGGEVASASIDGTRALILKPMEYMNVSGQAVQRAAHFHKVEAKNIVVVHDEIDFPFGRAKVKSGGGHGGHNGVRSIIQQLGTNEFPRVRVGIGRPTRDDGTPIGAADGNSVAN